MAPAEEGLITWLSSFSSSLQISVVSALFIIIYVTLHSLCASCYNLSDSAPSRHLERRESTNIPSAVPQNIALSQSAECMPSATDRPDHTFPILEAELNEENPYECISEPPLQPDNAEEQNKSPSPAMTKPDDNHSISAFSRPVNKPLTSADSQSHSQPSAVYASVNWKTKSQKSITPLCYADTELDMRGTVCEALPPIPDKHF
ncbi:uncharacterized protein [Danio rerio]|uniref:Uncharacterized protein n=1 Tax=Danio rerio TaxID=7955 RepID=A0AC58I5X6_DANRE